MFLRNVLTPLREYTAQCVRSQ